MSIKKVQDEAHALFEYIKEVCLLNQQTVLDVDKQLGRIMLRNLDDSSCIALSNRDTFDGDASHDNETLLSFRKPEFMECPSPDESLVTWLAPGWQDYRNAATYLEKKETKAPDELKEKASEHASMETIPAVMQEQYETFTDDPARVTRLESWMQKRAVWVEHEKHTAHLRDIFTDLFDIYNLSRQSPDTLEVVIGNGLLTDQQNKEIHHPLFLKRTSLSLDSVNNTLILSDTDEPAQVYLPMFSAMEKINSDVVRSLEVKAEEENIHPWDHHKGEDLLKSIAHQLHASSLYLGDGEEAVHSDERITIRWEPYIILRKRPDGTIKALESILNDIDEGAAIPDSLLGVLGNFKQDGYATDAEGIAESNTDTVGCDPVQLPLEDENILLPKPANREQMQIVRQIERSPAVLVQGPPGTGKTHTIANLLGHFLAQGQTVLVTSHTSKALTVLKEKIPAEIQALCVAVFGDNRADMEDSINTIIEHTSLSGFAAQKAHAEKIRAERHQVLLELQKARKLVYAIRHKETIERVFADAKEKHAMQRLGSGDKLGEA